MNVEIRDWVNDEILSYLPSDRIRQGDKILFRCPICGDSKKNSSKKRGYYYLKTASYHCFNCDITLSGLKLLQFFSGEEYSDVKGRFFKTMFDGNHYNSLVSQNQISCVSNKTDNVLSFTNVLKPEWKGGLTDLAKKYLEDRLVLKAPFLKEKFYSYKSKNGEYILIPWKLNGIDAYFQLNDFQKINKSGMKYIFPKNKDKLIYGLDNIDITFPYLICFEGVYDSLFIPNGIAIGGKTLTELQEKILKKRFPNHKIVYALDNDKPGLDATARAINKDSNSLSLYFKWFDNYTKAKDINDYVKLNNDVNIFNDKKYVESLIVDSITMKLWLAKNGYLDNGSNKQTWQKRKIQQRAHWDIFSNTPRKI